MTKRFLGLCMISAILFTSCSGKTLKNEPKSKSFFAMDAYMTITAYAMYHCTAKETMMIVFARILLGSIFGGNISAIFYSLSGAILCLAGMLLLRCVIDEKYIWICSILGAVLHNIGQIAVAVLMMKTTAVISYLPFLLVSGCIAGAFTGVCAQILIGRVRFDRIFHKEM